MFYHFNIKIKEVSLEEKLLRIKDVQEFVPFSKSKIYAMVKDDLFPRPIKIGGSVLWEKSAIVEYIQKATKK